MKKRKGPTAVEQRRRQKELDRQTQIISNAMIAATRASARRRTKTAPFVVALHPPGAIPDGQHGMAMDDFGGALQWANQGLTSGLFAEGQAFLGYPELSLMAQRAEYRIIVETLAAEMTRKGFKIKATGDVDKTDKITQLDEKMKDLCVLEVLKKVAEQDGFFGRGHIYIDTGDTDDPDELMVPLATDRAKVSKERPIVALRPVEAVWCYPTSYNSDNPLSPDWYKPSAWFAMGTQVHRSRLLTFIGREVPDLLKPAYSFGGLSLTQMAKPYVENWLRVRQSVTDIIHAFSVMVLLTDLSTSLQAGGDLLFRRVELFNNFRDNLGTMVIDKNTEDFKNVAAPIAGLHELQAQAQEHIAAVARLPLVKFTGIQPTGLNADSEGVMRAFYDTIVTMQKHFFDPHFKTIFQLVQMSLWGEVDSAITYQWEPLREMDEVQAAQIRKTDAETGNILVGNSVLHPVEERRRIANDEETLYPGLDVEDVPEDDSEEDDISITGEAA